VLAGALAGLALGTASLRFIETLLYEVKTTSLTMVGVPTLTILTVALLAALPPVIRALRTDPATALRAE
jgi:ABC-type antimicrobial peptide transport system permease subunit